jgi:lauroyl/myristoyl acyltransferase
MVPGYPACGWGACGMGTEYLQYRAIQILSRSLPRRAVYWVSDRIADRFYRRDRYAAPATRSNLRRILAFKGQHPSEVELDRLARQVFRGFARNFVDFFHFQRLTPQLVQRLFRVEGREHMERALAMGRGVLAISAHFGCFDLAAAVTRGLFGVPLHVAVLPYRDPAAEALFTRQRLRLAVTPVPLGYAVRRGLQALRSREIFALNCDVDFSLRDDRMTFLDGPVRLPFGAARIAAKTGAPIVPAFAIRLPDERYLMRYHRPIIPKPGMSVEQLEREIVRVLESVVLENPHCWYILSDIWDAEWSLEIARMGGPAELAAAKEKLERRSQA